MKHQWVEFGRTRAEPRRLRRCLNCGKLQQWCDQQSWGRVVGYKWEPKAGRCQRPGFHKRGDVAKQAYDLAAIVGWGFRFEPTIHQEKYAKASHLIAQAAEILERIGEGR